MRWLVFIALLFLLLMSLARFILYFAFKSPLQSLSHSLPAFWLGVRYDLRDVGILSVVLLLLGSVPAFDPFRTRLGKNTWFIILGFVSLLFPVVYTVDFAHYAYLSQRLNASLINYMADSDASLTMIWETYHVVWIVLTVLGVMLLILAILSWSYRRLSPAKIPVNASGQWIWGVVIFLLLGGGIFGHLGQYPLRWSDAFSLKDDRQAQLALNPFQSFFSSLKFRNQTFARKDVTRYYPLVAGYLGVAQPDSATLNYTRVVPRGEAAGAAADGTGSADPAGRPNIVLVICESFSGYKSSMWGNPLNTTPFFNTLCNQGVFFDHCFTPHYGTARGVWAVITGIPDVAIDNTSSRNPYAVNQHSIMDDVNGYDKYYFIGGSTSWANIRGVLENNIKDLHLYEQNNYSSPKLDVWGISDKNLFMESNKVLRQQTKPFLAIIQTSDNHRPYTIPEEDRAAFHPVTYPTDTLRKYGFQTNEELNAFRYTDFCYQYFIETARKESYFKNTIFVFIGDHGIRGDAGNMLPRAWTDEALTCFHVPLLFYAPGLLAPVRHTMNCSQIDVMPTLAGLAGVPYTNTTLGRDLFHLKDTLSNASLIMDHDAKEIGVVMNGYYFVRQLTGGKERLVSIRNNDPLPPGWLHDSLGNRMRDYTNGLYETARYLLVNNKKP
jgi:phosphoglycerol transferase MdoB-like AlkP superfamily enzyme